MSKKLISQVLLVSFIFVVSHSLCEAQELTGFSMPLTAPVYGALPLKFSDSKFALIVFKTTPEVLQKLVPKPLSPNPDNLMYVYTGRFSPQDYVSGEYSFPGGSYLEVALGVPATFGKTKGNYIVVMYLDQTLAGITIGREILGFPKKRANISFVEEDGKISSSVERYGTTIVKISFQRTEKVEPIPSRPPTPSFNLKFIPSVKKNAPPDVMQLTSTTSESRVKELYKGKATLEFGSLSADPLGKIPILEIVRADYTVFDGTMHYGEVIHDYLGKDKK